jgi:hypothetical protein
MGLNKNEVFVVKNNWVAAGGFHSTTLVINPSTTLKTGPSITLVINPSITLGINEPPASQLVSEMNENPAEILIVFFQPVIKLFNMGLG